MKKFLVIAIFATSFTACNNGVKKEETTTAQDSTTTTTPAEASPATPDTSKMMDTTHKMSADTTKK